MMKILSRLSDIETTKYIISLSVNKGGQFKLGMRWSDYISNWINPIDIERLESARTYIVEKKIRDNINKFSSINLLYDDGMVATFTHRGWGDLLAATWSQEENVDYTYALFGW